MGSVIRRPDYCADWVFPVGTFSPCFARIRKLTKKTPSGIPTGLAAPRHLSNNETGSGGRFPLGPLRRSVVNHRWAIYRINIPNLLHRVKETSYAWTYIDVHFGIHMHLYMYVCIHTDACMHTYTDVYICTHIYVVAFVVVVVAAVSAASKTKNKNKKSNNRSTNWSNIF